MITQPVIVGLWVGLALLAANLPWISDRLFFVWPAKRGKPAWFRVVEWSVLYGLVVGIGFGFEHKTTGTIHPQDWEFYVVTACLMIVGALPGFVYRFQLKRLLEHSR